MKHPYSTFEGTELWTAINNALDDLTENQHIQETTPREFIVGHLCSRIEGYNDIDLCDIN